MGRDLLYKPPVPIQLPDEDIEDSKGKQEVRNKGSSTQRANRLGRRPSSHQPDTASPKAKASEKRLAHENAYFNKDVNAVREANLGSKPMQVLRGAEGATDLRQIVLPPIDGDVDSAILMEAGQAMGVGGSSLRSLESVLGRHAAWLRQQGRRVEDIQQRKRLLEQMVNDRKTALRRQRAVAEISARKNRTLLQATTALSSLEACSGDVESTDDDSWDHNGQGLLDDIGEEASGLQQRLVRVLGIKKRPL